MKALIALALLFSSSACNATDIVVEESPAPEMAMPIPVWSWSFIPIDGRIYPFVCIGGQCTVMTKEAYDDWMESSGFRGP